jgi:hypothetical protein
LILPESGAGSDRNKSGGEAFISSDNIEEELIMEYIIHLNNITDFTSTRQTGKKVYQRISEMLEKRDADKSDTIIIDFSDIKSVSPSFIQETYVHLVLDGYNVEFTNANEAVLDTLRMLVRLFETDPSIFKKVDHPSPNAQAVYA